MRAEHDDRVTLTALFVRAAVVAIEAFPILNSSLDAGRDEIVYHGAVHIGVAVASDDGLVVPVVHDAHDRDVVDLGREVARVTESGRAGHLSPEMLRGATFTVTNFGTEGGRFATPIVRPPQVAILGFGAVRVRPVVDGDVVVAAPTLPVSLSADHRVVDGRDATGFLEHVLATLARAGAARHRPDRRKSGIPAVVFALRNGGAHVAEWHDTTEEYLEAILEIEEEGTIPIRARLVERLGLSAPAVSETVNRLVDHGYAELMDDRSLRLTARVARSPRRSCAATASPSGCSSTSSGSSGRRSTRRPTAGSTRSRPTSRRSWCCSSATRPRARTATRSPARHTRSRVRRRCRSSQMQPGPVIVAPHQREGRDRRRRHRVPRRRRAHPRLQRRRDQHRAPRACRSPAPRATQTVPRKLAQLIYAIPA